jgi:hypothetical protein
MGLVDACDAHQDDFQFLSVLILAMYQLIVLPTMVSAAVMLVAASASVMVSPLSEWALGSLLL